MKLRSGVIVGKSEGLGVGINDGILLGWVEGAEEGLKVGDDTAQ